MQRRLPPLESLRVFEACGRHANFSRAADELGVTPTAVSLRIRDLERQLGIQLFARHGPKVTLSAAGAALATKLSQNLSNIRDAIEEATASAPPLRVTVVPTVAAMWLTPRLSRYQSRPGAARIKLDVSSDVRPDRQFDVAIRSGRRDWPGMRQTILFPTEGTPMLSPALAASVLLNSPRDLAQLPLFADADWPRWFSEAGAEEPLRLGRSGIEYPTQDLAAAAAATGAGVALLSPTLFAPLLADGRLVQPFPQIIRGPNAYSAVVAATEKRPAVLDFLDWLCLEVGQASG